MENPGGLKRKDTLAGAVCLLGDLEHKPPVPRSLRKYPLLEKAFSETKKVVENVSLASIIQCIRHEAVKEVEKCSYLCQVDSTANLGLLLNAGGLRKMKL